MVTVWPVAIVTSFVDVGTITPHVDVASQLPDCCEVIGPITMLWVAAVYPASGVSSAVSV